MKTKTIKPNGIIDVKVINGITFTFYPDFIDAKKGNIEFRYMFTDINRVYSDFIKRINF